jgi:hypothetical protein
MFVAARGGVRLPFALLSRQTLRTFICCGSYVDCQHALYYLRSACPCYSWLGYLQLVYVCALCWHHDCGAVGLLMFMSEIEQLSLLSMSSVFLCHTRFIGLLNPLDCCSTVAAAASWCFVRFALPNSVGVPLLGGRG